MAASRDTPIIMKARLEAALAKVKPRQTLSAEPMAELIGMSWGGFKRGYIDTDPDLPIKVEGGNGRKWEFQPTKVIRHLIKRCEEKIAANEALNRRNAEIASVELPADEQSADITAVAKLVDLTLRMQGAKEKQGHFVPADVLSSFIAGYNSSVVNGIMGVAQQIDPTGILPSVVRAQMDEELRRVAANVNAAAGQFIKDFDAGIKQGRTA